MDNDEREWKQAMYERAVADQQLKSLAWHMAQSLGGPGDPALGAGDLEAARRYLRVCVLNMSVYELQTVTNSELAGLLARGALGAARHRAGRGESAERTRGAAAAPPSPAGSVSQRRDRRIR